MEADENNRECYHCSELIAMAQRLSARSDTVVDESITLLDERLGLDSLSIGDFLGWRADSIS